MVENFSSPKRSTITWPTLLDYTKIDCQRILRRLELEAYAKIVTVFRAQGPLTGEKRKTLQDLQRLLSIASDRHKAEVRRALNDEELATICESICGKEADDAWILEGKRIAPLLDRGIPQTAFLPRANLASAKWAELNSKLPRPFDTADKAEEPGRDTDWVRSDERRSSATGENVTSPVPEAAMEVTCEADISKTSASLSEMEKDANDNVPIGCNESATSLLCLPDNSTATSILVGADKQTRIEETLSKSMFPLSSIKTSAEKEPSGLLQPSNGCQSYAHSNADFSPTAKRRIYSLPSQPHLPGSDEAPSNRQPVPLSTGLPTDHSKPGEVGGLSNGVTPLVSQSRSVIFGPSSNVISSVTPTTTSSNNSQALQMTKVLGTSCGPDETMTSRLQHNTTTIAVTGASGTSTLVPQQSVVTTSPARLMKTHIFHPQQPQQIYSYTSFANAVPVASGSVAHLPSPSLPSDNKKQPVVIQQTGGAATSGNVIVVHRGASGRLIAGGASSAIHGSGITHTASTAVAGQPSSTVMPIAGATTPSGKPLRILSVPASIMSASSNTYTPTFHQTFSVSQRTAPSIGGANASETPLSSEQGIYYYVTNPQHSGKNPSPVKPRSSAPVALKVFEAPAPPVPPSTLPAVDLDAECPERERTVHSSMTPDKPVRAKSSSVEKQPHQPAVSGCSVNILTVPGVNPRSPISVAATMVVPASSSTVPAVPATASTVLSPVHVRAPFSKPAESATCAPVSLVSVLEPKRPRVAFVPSSQPL
ncbi:hypothetical protein AAHC03_01838 [Spirometra sp. Aus1]